MYDLLIFIASLFIGSFANVCIYRLENDLSIAYPGSKCTNCNQFLKWYELIPVLSYVWQRGRCRSCSAPISLQYPIVEILVAAVIMFIYYSANNWLFVPYAAIAFVLIIIAFMDINSNLIDDRLILLGFLLVVPLQLYFGNGELLLKGGFCALFWSGFTYWLGRYLYGPDSFGSGDITLSVLIGSFVGWVDFWFIYMLSSLIAVAFSFSQKQSLSENINKIVAFGPFLVLATAFDFLIGGITKFL